MANNVNTSIQINGSEETIKEISKIFNHESGGDKYAMNSEWISRTITEKYDSDYTWTRENIGPKWVYLEDDMFFDDYIELKLVSAWDYPDLYLKNLLKKLLEIDENITIEGQFQDEMPNFVGGFYGSKNGYEDVMVDEDDCESPDYDDYDTDEEYEEAQQEFFYELDEIMDECQSSSKENVESTIRFDEVK